MQVCGQRDLNKARRPIHHARRHPRDEYRLREAAISKPAASGNSLFSARPKRPAFHALRRELCGANAGCIALLLSPLAHSPLPSIGRRRGRHSTSYSTTWSRTLRHSSEPRRTLRTENKHTCLEAWPRSALAPQHFAYPCFSRSRHPAGTSWNSTSGVARSAPSCRSGLRNRAQSMTEWTNRLLRQVGQSPGVLQHSRGAFV